MTCLASGQDVMEAQGGPQAEGVAAQSVSVNSIELPAVEDHVNSFEAVPEKSDLAPADGDGNLNSLETEDNVLDIDDEDMMEKQTPGCQCFCCSGGATCRRVGFASFYGSNCLTTPASRRCRTVWGDRCPPYTGSGRSYYGYRARGRSVTSQTITNREYFRI
eukprot:Cvel_9151.t2-p1 / transcript=Cvel_9151.t2 / gene=Cvel_9151 / organism=Chromera_velia_CCMP2878 / gene_product=hypothetical protein / transcript_product=hypothetical protein / location=Cvel_scaffold521:11382-11864(+) / protein_length=161 / sequence_SO=supercontig / SO=protein_coding / is_pseudo=false